MSDNQSDSNLKKTITISDMYENWYLDYASYVILERAIPRYEDGLKPVQRRILHALKKMDDGRFHKVANVIGQTMQYHPHGDAAINDALVSIGQKDLLIDTQGNWGDPRTGDRAAAARYIETRLTDFTKEVAFNNNITVWVDSYDGRNKEPRILPIKFPVLLYQGAEGIAVGLSTKILPHNFIEIIKSIISYLKGRSISLVPDFVSGGFIDIDNYNKGARGGKVRVRAEIDIRDKNTLVIKSVPYGVTTLSLIESIIKANDKGKIKIKNIEDNTSENVEIVAHLIKGTSPDMTIDALYAFTSCEVSISPNCCVIIDNTPQFISVNKLLKLSVDYYMEIFRMELNYNLDTLLDNWHNQSLEIIFISNKIYRKIEESHTWESVINIIKESLIPFSKDLKKEVSEKDIVRLTDLKIKRISNYDLGRAKDSIVKIQEDIKAVKYNIENLKDYAISYYEKLLSSYSDNKDRKTVIQKFDTISARRVAIANKKLFINKVDGFIGYSLKNDEFISECSELDNIIIFLQDGTYLITPIESKKFVGTDILHAAVWKKNDKHMVYNYVYKDANTGWSYVKRFLITSAIKDRVYSLTKNDNESKALYLTANPNSEAEVVSIDLDLRSKARIKNLSYDFSNLDIKSKNSKGNILTKYPIKRINQLSKGDSTLGGKEFWFDEAILRLNHDNRGTNLGKFDSNDSLLLINDSGGYINLELDINRRFKSNEIEVLEKFNPEKVISCMYYDGETKNYFIKRFKIETLLREKEFKFINDKKGTRLVLVTIASNISFRFNYHSKSGSKKVKEIVVNDFVAIKGWKSIGNKIPSYKRMSGFETVVLENEAVLLDEITDKQEDEEEREGDNLNLFE